ncbi:MAG: restriction endonuclease, partial [Bdellovibrionales bacterium]|nr:restriction endonuclease [Bdellovibrionales bacterium]
MTTPLRELLNSWRNASFSEREKGERFERLIQAYLLEDDKYNFEDVWLWKEWAELKGEDGRDTGIDLVALDKETGVYWAIQCKFYAEDAKIYKRHIDSFFTQSGKAPFGQRLIVLTTASLSEHVESAQQGQQIPCINLTLDDL